MQVVFQFGCITTLGRVKPGDLVDLPREEASHLIERGMCVEHRVSLPQSFAGPAGADGAPAGQPFRRVPDAEHSDGTPQAVAPAGGTQLQGADLSTSHARSRRRRGYGR